MARSCHKFNHGDGDGDRHGRWNLLGLPAAEERLLGGVHLLEDARAALGRDGRRGAEADVVARHGVERRVHLPERRPPQQRLLPPVLGHPRVGQLPELRHRVRHARVRLVQADRRPHLPDHLLGLAHVLLVRRKRRAAHRTQRQQQRRRAQPGPGEHVAPACAAAISGGTRQRLYDHGGGGEDGGGGHWGRRGPHLYWRELGGTERSKSEREDSDQRDSFVFVDESQEGGNACDTSAYPLSRVLFLRGCVWAHKILEDRAAMVHGSNTFLVTQEAPRECIPQRIMTTTNVNTK